MTNRARSYLLTPDGCDVCPQCLRCPLPQCRLDDRAGYAHFRQGPRDARVLELTNGGMQASAVAEAVGVTSRTVYRILARART